MQRPTVNLSDAVVKFEKPIRELDFLTLSEWQRVNVAHVKQRSNYTRQHATFDRDLIFIKMGATAHTIKLCFHMHHVYEILTDDNNVRDNHEPQHRWLQAREIVKI